MNASELLRNLLATTELPELAHIEELVGLPVRLRVKTGGDAYDTVGLPIQSARIRLGVTASCLELTFPPQLLGHNARSRGYTLLSVEHWGAKDLWLVRVRRCGPLGFLLPVKYLAGGLRTEAAKKRLKAAA